MKVKYKLYQFPLCPFSRKVRLFLLEKNINVDIATENFWEKERNLLQLIQLVKFLYYFHMNNKQQFVIALLYVNF